MSLANQLTLLRVGLAFLFMGFFFLDASWGKAAALATFAVASITDLSDGWLARRWNQVSQLGILLDPIADKLLILSALFALVGMKFIPAWMGVLIMSREVILTGLRLSAYSRQMVLAPSAFGKQKTVSQMAVMLVILGLVVVNEGHRLPEAQIRHWIFWLMLVAVATTVASGLSYLWRYRTLFANHAEAR